MKNIDKYKTPDEWYKNNKDELKKHRTEWIAYTCEGIIAHDREFNNMVKMADKISADYVIAHIHKYDFTETIRILPIRFRTALIHDWQPTYEVVLKYSEVKKVKMLVDSGADISLIPNKLGSLLGLIINEQEIIHKAEGIGGSVDYVMRKINIQIDTHSFTAPIAWVQTKDCKDIIMGREIVFDLFDIEFKQAVEEIIFRKR
ncbi:MAG: retropepsin-like aspartic protease [Bacteroidota bacterium]